MCFFIRSIAVWMNNDEYFFPDVPGFDISTAKLDIMAARNRDGDITESSPLVGDPEGHLTCKIFHIILPIFQPAIEIHYRVFRHLYFSVRNTNKKSSPVNPTAQALVQLLRFPTWEAAVWGLLFKS